MGYETAPATALVATACACCARPLVDAASLAAGMGPVCREKHGYKRSCPEDIRTEVNAIVYAIAARQDGPEVLSGLARLREIGFATLADRIEERLAPVIIEEQGDCYVVRAPYSEASVQAFRAVPGRRWDPREKANRFPLASRPALYGALRRAYPGHAARGPKGYFEIPAAA